MHATLTERPTVAQRLEARWSPRLGWALAGAGALLALALFVVRQTYPNYDTYYTLVWGQELAGGHLPDYDVFRSPTPHPLATLVGWLLAPFGTVSDRLLVLLSLFLLVGFLVILFRFTQRLLGSLVALLAVAVVAGVLVVTADSVPLLLVLLAVGLVLGVLLVLPIGGADMPVVISLLNACTGTVVAMAGFVLENPVLIIAGALVGASGAILIASTADDALSYVLAFVAVAFAAMNVTGGYVVTDRMLGMFRRRREPVVAKERRP